MKNLITNEVPIKSKDEDLLNYYPFANKVQKIIQGYSNNSEPLTIGIYGKWGTGKTSLLNLIEKHIEIFQKDKEDKPYIKFHYSPWLYQNKEEMLFDFFENLIRKLNYKSDDHLKQAGILIKKYSGYLKAIRLSASGGIPKLFNVGVKIEPYEFLQALGEHMQGEEKGINELKKDIDDELLKSNKKIIVFIDDIDRLDKDEIFTLFKIIKINADFKNLIFITCLDPNHVAKAIHHRYGNEEKSGLEFIKKIINIPLELPLIEDYELDYFVKEKLKPILSLKSVKKECLDELLSSLKGSYFTSPREVIRVINSFAISFYAIGDEVNVHDLFWIEYLKIKSPNTYQAIKNYAKDFKAKMFLNVIINFNLTHTQEKEESGLRKEFFDNHKEVYPVINFLFPMKKNHLTATQYQNPKINRQNILDSELRINHINHFEKYFSLHIRGKVSELSFSNFKAEIVSGKDEEALNILKNLIERTNERKIVYRIKSEIEALDGELYDKLILFLLNNINEFSEISDVNTHSIEIIQAIAVKLKESPEENKSLVLSLIEKMDYNQLSWFLGTFKYQSYTLYEQEINEILIEKVKSSSEHPFFNVRNISRMIMEIWSKIDAQQLQDYILKHLDTEDAISAFFKTFPDLWNLDINGVFKEEDFGYLKDVLKIDNAKLFNKVQEIFPEISNLDLVQLEELRGNWDDKINNSGLQNVKQFAYWHLKEEERRK